MPIENLVPTLSRLKKREVLLNISPPVYIKYSTEKERICVCTPRVPYALYRKKKSGTQRRAEFYVVSASASVIFLFLHHALTI